MYIVYKWQPSLNQNHAHGNKVRPVEKKQNCALSEKGAWIARKNIKDAAVLDTSSATIEGMIEPNLAQKSQLMS